MPPGMINALLRVPKDAVKCTVDDFVDCFQRMLSTYTQSLKHTYMHIYLSLIASNVCYLLTHTLSNTHTYLLYTLSLNTHTYISIYLQIDDFVECFQRVLYLHTHAHALLHTYIYVYLHICISTYMYIYIYLHSVC